MLDQRWLVASRHRPGAEIHREVDDCNESVREARVQASRR